MPSTEQGFVDQFRHAVNLITGSLNNDRKEFLEDSLKNSIDDLLSKKAGLRANRWIGVVMNDTVGQRLGPDHGDVLQLYIPVAKTADTTTAEYDFMRSITVTMGLEVDDQDMMKLRKRLSDGDTVVFSGYFTPMGRQVPDVLSNSCDFFVNPSLDFIPTEIYKKGASEPHVRPEPDTAGLAKAPVKVAAKMTVKMVDKERFINIKVTVKNTSDKAITKLSIRWLVTNKAGRPAKVNGATGAYQQGFFNGGLDPGATRTDEWQHESPDGEKVQLIDPKWVTFYNGTQWNVGKH